MPFERFIYNKNGTVPKVSMTPRKQFMFNKGAVKLLGLYRNQYIALYFDQETRQIGFQPEWNSKQDNKAVIFDAEDRATLPATAFYDCVGLSYPTIKQYTIRHQNGFYCIQLER